MQAAELKLQIVNIFPPLEEKPDLVDFMVDFFEGDYWLGVDFPHQRHHNVRVRNDAQVLSRLTHCDSQEWEFLEKGAIVHDFGRTFVVNNLLKEHEHDNGTFVIAKLMGMLMWGFSDEKSTRFAEGVAQHIKNVLPKNSERWWRILRDSDRTSRIGLGLLIDIAWWMGYRDEYIDKTEEDQLIDDQILFDLSYPDSPEKVQAYDAKPRQYFDEHILPWLLKEGKFPKLIKDVHLFVDRIYGVRNFRKKRPWKIEPVIPEAQFLIKPRIMSLNRFLKDHKLDPIHIPHYYVT